MIRVSFLAAMLSVLILGGSAWGQEGKYPIMEKIAQKVIQKYQSSSCQDLAKQKANPPAGKQAQVEARAVDILRKDPEMRQAFINRVAAPIANKLFECGMIP